MTTHTPAPWHIGKSNIAKMDGFRFHRFPISGSGQAIASVWNGSADRDLGLGNGEANARLIAAAPDLLAALKALLNSLSSDEDDAVTGIFGGETISNLKAARAAIAKVTD